jgi:hypothetical protein
VPQDADALCACVCAMLQGRSGEGACMAVAGRGGGRRGVADWEGASRVGSRFRAPGWVVAQHSAGCMC